MKWDRTKGRPEPVRALDRIREVENGESLVDFRKVAPRVVVFRESVIPYVRQRVAEMMLAVSESLPDGISLAVTDAWRPLARQQRIYEFMTRCVLEVNPEISRAALKRTVNRWVAPPDRKAPPGHCTGAAIDVTLLGPDGKDMDMVSPFERLSGGPTFVYGLTEEAHRNRMLLYETMMAAGFSNCRDEWWHYSYGDAGWAVRLGFDSCPYGVARLDASLYREQEREWLERMRDRPNPFLPEPK
ncbi:MAG: D-alanyl-D-alanine carboxypeptidase family protein [Fimbriimonadaceae bacterium]|nr:D-alanyl-D-alanine carboxypeptidase family protein [Fimbriimonadaceae bacterium]